MIIEMIIFHDTILVVSYIASDVHWVINFSNKKKSPDSFRVFSQWPFAPIVTSVPPVWWEGYDMKMGLYTDSKRLPFDWKERKRKKEKNLNSQPRVRGLSENCATSDFLKWGFLSFIWCLYNCKEDHGEGRKGKTSNSDQVPTLLHWPSEVCLLTRTMSKLIIITMSSPVRSPTFPIWIFFNGFCLKRAHRTLRKIA